MITKEKMLDYKTKLIAKRDELIREINKYENPENFGDDTEDEDEEADEAEELGNRLSVARIKKEELKEVEAALSRIEKGMYGICEHCGKEISEAMLSIIPESSLCVDCKKSR